MRRFLNLNPTSKQIRYLSFLGYFGKWPETKEAATKMITKLQEEERQCVCLPDGPNNDDYDHSAYDEGGDF